MHVVFGSGPVARSLVVHLGRRGPVALANASPEAGPFLWRSVDLATGRGVHHALQGAQAVFVVLEGGEPTDGLFLMLSRVAGLQGVVVVPLGHRSPPGLGRCRGLSLLHVGPCWGPEEPLVASWTRTVSEGRGLWVGDPGPIAAVSMPDVVATAVEAARRAGVRWTLSADREVRLPDLAEAIGRHTGRPVYVRRVPWRVAAWRAGIPPQRVQGWLDAPKATTLRDGWAPDVRAGTEGWVLPERT